MAGPQGFSGSSRVLAEVARLTGAPGVELVGVTPRGESRSTFIVAAGSEELVVKVAPGDAAALENQRQLVRLVGALRSRGYPAPEYLGAGEADGLVLTVQRLLPGKTLEPAAGGPPEADLFAAILPELLAAVELQAGAGDLADPPWPRWLLRTIEAGGDGYCLHETMRQAGGTARLLDRLQELARRHYRGPVRRGDVVHFDMNPANVLHDGGRLSGIVDWNMPFAGACQGDRGFDLATLLFYSYDLPATRETLWERAVATSGIGWTTVYLCHLSLRQVEWARRHYPGSAAETRFTGIAWTILDDCEARAGRAVLGVVPGGGGDVGAAGGQGPAGDAGGELLDPPVGCLLGAMVRAASRGQVGLAGRAVGPGDGVVQVGVLRRGLAAGSVAGRGAGADQVLQTAAGHGSRPRTAVDGAGRDGLKYVHV